MHAAKNKIILMGPFVWCALEMYTAKSAMVLNTNMSSFLERIRGKIHPDLWAETKRFQQARWNFNNKVYCLSWGGGYYAQFLEWVDKGTKCPYCEGLGYNICDVCEGKTLIRA
ncbi:hypothetical protein IFM89_010335 [Coptis chinensis]|uniref:Uncharacterized protein n=1 Tax=Coptis chinensis TaxID=261450 RepID=A0A835LVH5_9MAGN|nr:hypothetical protein IFM89_010335 [Coptis chinensis]